MLDQFNTGYCTLWWDGVWAHCCQAHDIAYGELSNKFIADLDLAVCVAQTGHFWMAVLMFLGVSIGGIFFYPWAKKKLKKENK